MVWLAIRLHSRYIVAQRSRLSLDDRPGALPEITSDEDSVTFLMSVAISAQRATLRLRCDVHGDVWVTIEETRHEE